LTKEKVLVFDEQRMEDFKGLPGVSTIKEDLRKFGGEIIHTAVYIDRDEAETNPKYKQIIPYTVLIKDDNVLVYKRTKKGGEGRLHEKLSIGIGGHVNPIDGLGLVALGEAIGREINEETTLPAYFTEEECKLDIIGLLYDPSNDVGKVHVGLVSTVVLGKDIPQPEPKDPACAEFNWVPINELKENPPENLENWSKMVLKVL